MIGEVLYAGAAKFDTFSFNLKQFYKFLFQLQSKYQLMYSIV